MWNIEKHVKQPGKAKGRHKKFQFKYHINKYHIKMIKTTKWKPQEGPKEPSTRTTENYQYS